jgi:hypothetical protein
VSAPTPTSSSAEPTRGRRFLQAVVLWVYGIAISVFLLSIWGRSVASDTALVASAASRVARSEFVATRVEAWFERALADVGLEGGSSGLGSAIAALPEVESATATLIGDIVEAMAGTEEGPVVVDVASVYRPAAPAVAASLQAMGLPVTEGDVESVVDRLEPLVLVPDRGERPLVGRGSGPARALTVGTLLGLGTMLAAGGTAVYLSDDRRRMVRTLLTRLSIAALNFAIFFRLSAWVVDPRGGRAGIGGAAAEVLGAKLWIPLAVMVVSGAGAWTIRRRRSGAADSMQDGT